MDRKLLFYLLGSVEDSLAKLSLRDEVKDSLPKSVQINIVEAQVALEHLRCATAIVYSHFPDDEDTETPLQSPMEYLC